jgi:urea transport system permease protein
LFLMGGLFIAVVMFFPNGLAGLWDDYGHHITKRFEFIKGLFEKNKSDTDNVGLEGTKS